MRGPCACPGCPRDPQGGQAQGPHPSAQPPLVPTTNLVARAIPKDKHKAPTHPLHGPLSLRQTLGLNLTLLGALALARTRDCLIWNSRHPRTRFLLRYT